MSEEGGEKSIEDQFKDFLAQNKIDASALKGTKEESIFNPKE